MSLSGKSYLVTGASRGIGRAIAEAIATAGGKVALTARSADALADVASCIQATGGTALALPADAGDMDAMAAVLEQTVSEFGGLDGLVNNAGMIDPIARLEAAEAEDWAHIFNINLVSPVVLTRMALPHLRAADGALVNISSGAAHRPLEGWSAYCSTKAALWMATQALHLEEGDQIAVYGASPGTVDTEMQVQIRASGVNPISQIPRENLAPPSLPAAGVAWLLSAKPDDLKGQDVNVRDAAFLARAGIEA
jgi:NAD(P)-dependent dehydrogenase (short-subunit alcohol dehydrogenase family)